MSVNIFRVRLLARVRVARLSANDPKLPSTSMNVRYEALRASGKFQAGIEEFQQFVLSGDFLSNPILYTVGHSCAKSDEPDLHAEFVFPAEVVGNNAFGNANFRSDLRERSLTKSLHGKDRERGAQDLFAARQSQ